MKPMWAENPEMLTIDLHSHSSPGDSLSQLQYLGVAQDKGLQTEECVKWEML